LKVLNGIKKSILNNNNLKFNLIINKRNKNKKRNKKVNSKIFK